MSIDPSPVQAEPQLPVGLPMPMDLSLLDPATPRVRVRTRTERFPYPVPNGWFVVATAAELDPGQVLARHYFEEDLVVWRGTDGTPHTADAYCPHLGAHLAVGGKVQGDSLTCPFHGWTFDGGAGQCVDIPYATSERIPQKARIRTYPTLERNGLVWAWHHRFGGEPFFDVPDVPEFADAGWSPPHMIEFRIATTCQEMAENNHDYAHFTYVHGVDPGPADEHIEGTYKRIENFGMVRETFGLGLGLLRRAGEMVFLSTVTPIDRENVHIRWTFSAPVTAGQDAPRELAQALGSGVSQDIPIWENKIHREHPVLTRGESGITAHRKWARQFYSWDDEVDDEV